MSNFFRLTCVEIIFLIRFLTDPRYIAHLWRKNGNVYRSGKKIYTGIYGYLDRWSGFHTFAQQRKTRIDLLNERIDMNESVDRNFNDRLRLLRLSYEWCAVVAHIEWILQSGDTWLKCTHFSQTSHSAKLKNTECNHDESTKISRIQTTRKGHGRQVTLETQINCNCGGSVTINRR